jgi:hypothetical protein
MSCGDEPPFVMQPSKQLSRLLPLLSSLCRVMSIPHASGVHLQWSTAPLYATPCANLDFFSISNSGPSTRSENGNFILTLNLIKKSWYKSFILYVCFCDKNQFLSIHTSSFCFSLTRRPPLFAESRVKNPQQSASGISRNLGENGAVGVERQQCRSCIGVGMRRVARCTCRGRLFAR